MDALILKNMFFLCLDIFLRHDFTSFIANICTSLELNMFFSLNYVALVEADSSLEGTWKRWSLMPV